jgi:hypothetical protein
VSQICARSWPVLNCPSPAGFNCPLILVQLAMADKQTLFIVDDKDRDREINFFVAVRHESNSKAGFDGGFNGNKFFSFQKADRRRK